MRFATKGVFDDLTKEHLPRIHSKLESLGVVQTVTLSWFLTLFLCSMPFDSAVRVVDAFFYDGARVVFQIALCILKENEVRGDFVTSFADRLMLPLLLRRADANKCLKEVTFTTLKP